MVRWTVIGALVVGAVVTVSIEAEPTAQAIEDHFATRAPIHPQSWEASHSDKNRAASLAGDGYNNTWWSTGYSGSSAGQWLQADFTEPISLLNVIITPGVSTQFDQQTTEALPEQLTVTVTSWDNSTATHTFVLDDGGAQTFDLRARSVKSVRFTIDSAWNTAQNKEVAIARGRILRPQEQRLLTLEPPIKTPRGPASAPQPAPCPDKGECRHVNP